MLVPLLGHRSAGKAATMVLLRMSECASSTAVLSTPGASSGRPHLAPCQVFMTNLNGMYACGPMSFCRQFT